MASIRDMRIFLLSKNIRTNEMIEKKEIKNAYKNFFIENIDAVHAYNLNISSFDCLIRTNSATPSIIFLVFHGFGANNEDLESIANSYFRLYKDIKTLFVFPNAFRLNELTETSDKNVDISAALYNLCGTINSFGWWYIDVQKLSTRIINQDFDKIINDKPNGLENARSKILCLMDSISELYEVEKSKFILFGFSQGAMLSLDLLFHLNTYPLYIGLFSCGPMMQNEYKNILDTMDKNKKNSLLNTHIFQTHGSSDIIIPRIGGELVRRFLSTENFKNVEFQEFDGGHTISDTMVDYFFEKIAPKVRSNL